MRPLALRSPVSLALVDERGRLATWSRAPGDDPSGGRSDWAGDDVGVPRGVPVVDATWVGPAVHDAHVHLAFGSFAECLSGGVGSVTDLGAPLVSALRWRSAAVAVAGPVLTPPGGYPSRGWGAGGFTAPLEAVAELVAAGVDLVKVALEPAGGQPVPGLDELRAVVRVAHDAGLPVTVHALTVAMVERALEAGVDELAHTPVERLPGTVVERIAAAGVPVVSTLEALSHYDGSAAQANAAALVAAGVTMRYGTDLGNAGTRPGVDPRELARLAAAGLGAAGALAAATRPPRIGEPARLAALDTDPVVDPSAWRRPLAVVSGEQVVLRPA